MFASGKTAATGSSKEPQFNYVTMLLHGDGTNGAQNNTFLDSSTNAFSITRNGNTTQGSFSPYGSNWSNHFLNSASSYLTTTMTGQTFGTGDFTIEFWINPSSTALSDIIDTRSAGDSINAYSVQFDGTSLVFANTANYLSVPVAQFPIGAWTHVAYTRASGTMKVYVNGTQYGSSVSLTSDFTNTRMDIGVAVRTYYYSGYISNLRLVRGTAVYTSNFTPSTTPLTAISGTALLTCQSNRFIDNSSNAFSITVSGTPSVQRFNPFGTATAYSTSVIGGSGYFDGSGDYLGCGSQSAYAFGTGDFTLNVWVYLTSAPTYMSIADTRSSGWALAIDANRAIYLYSDIGPVFIVTSAVGAVPLNAWTYVTVKRVSGTMTLYLNAVSINSAASAQNFSNTTLTVGANGSGGEPFFGYICDFQAIKGTGTTPTLPTAPLTNVANTSLLLNYTNGAIFDNAMMNDLETVGNAQISTSVKKYGTGSLAFDGTDDVLSFKNNPSFAFGTGSFTIEFWINGPLNNDKFILEGRNAIGTMHITTGGSSSTAGVLRYVGSSTIVSSNVITDSTWHHCAIVRNGSSNITLYVDGISVGTGTDTTNYTTTTGTFDGIGGRAGVCNYLTAYIDDFRITKGYARYTANFTAPTAAFSDTGPY